MKNSECVMVRAEHLVTAVKDGVVHAGESVADTANSAVSSVGETISDMAGSIRAHTPAVMEPYTKKATAGLKHAGEYLEHGTIGGIGHDLADVIRRHPVPAVLAGVALGYMLAHMLMPKRD